jgi:hypothetical protein
MSKCSVSVTGLVLTKAFVLLKVQGQDIGSSVAFDYDNKIMTFNE